MKYLLEQRTRDFSLAALTYNHTLQQCELWSRSLSQARNLWLEGDVQHKKQDIVFCMHFPYLFSMGACGEPWPPLSARAACLLFSRMPCCLCHHSAGRPQGTGPVGSRVSGCCRSLSQSGFAGRWLGAAAEQGGGAPHRCKHATIQACQPYRRYRPDVCFAN